LRVISLNVRKSEIELVPEDLDDLYVLSLILERGDLVYSWTLRMLRRRKGVGERGERIRAYMGVKVERVEFQRFTTRLRIRGVVVESPEILHAKGSHHTITVEPGRRIKIIKGRLNKYHLSLIEKSGKKEVALILSMGDEDAVVARLRDQGLEVLATIPVYKEEAGSVKAMLAGSIKEVVKVLKRYYVREGPLILLAPSLILDWVAEELRKALGPPRELIKIKVSEGGLAGIYEAVRSGRLRELAKRIRSLESEEAMNRIYKTLMEDKDRVAIGLDEAISASRLGAVDELLILDSFLRERANEDKIKELIRLSEEKGAKVRIVPNSLEAGAKLKSLGGVAALLKYKLPLR